MKLSIAVANSIVAYESHVKYMFRTEGCREEEFMTPFLSQIRKGVRRTLPSTADSRRALLLPNFMTNEEFRNIKSKSDILWRFATILGFVGMLRPHTFDQINPESFTIVLMNRSSILMRGTASWFRKQLDDIRRKHRILGFYIQFQSKTMQNARAYFPSLCSRTKTTSYEPMCPMRSLVEVSSNCMVRKSFMKKINKGKKSLNIWNGYRNTSSCLPCTL